MRKGKVSVMLIIMGVLLLTTPQASVAAWYDEPMANAISLGCFEPGVNPEATASRYDLVEALWRLDGKPMAEPNIHFKDVTEHQVAVTWATENGIIKGYDDDHFGGNDSLTREQMSLIFANYINGVGIIGYPIAPNLTNLSKFTDANLISDWAVDSLSILVEVGMLKGNSNGTLNPKGTLTIAELASLILQRGYYYPAGEPLNPNIPNSPIIPPAPTSPTSSYMNTILAVQDYAIQRGWTTELMPAFGYYALCLENREWWLGFMYLGPENGFFGFTGYRIETLTDIDDPYMDLKIYSAEEAYPVIDKFSL